MQFFRAAYWPLNDKWPDLDVVAELKKNYSSDQLVQKYELWEGDFESLAQAFHAEFKDTEKFNFCPSCGEVARSPTFERCEECGCTWTLNSNDKIS
jgi:hypothetical protein